MVDLRRSAAGRNGRDLAERHRHPLTGLTVVRNARIFDSESATLRPLSDVYVLRGRVTQVLTAGAIADKALERGAGARGLRAIMEELLVPVMYDIPDRDDVAEVVITPGCVHGAAQPQLVLRDEAEKTA